MKTRQRMLVSAGAVVLSLTMALRAEAADKVKFLTEWVWWPPHIGFLVAQEKGFFTEMDLDVEITQGQGSGSTAQLVAQGAYEIGHLELPVAAQAITKGAKMQAVATTTAKGANGVIFKKGSIKDVQELKGQTIGASAQAAGTLLFPAFLNANSLTGDDVPLLMLPNEGVLPALLSDKVNVVIGPGYYYGPLAAAQGHEIDWWYMADYGVPILGYGLVANETMVKERPEVIRRFLAAVEKGFKYSVENVDESVEIYSRVTGQKQDAGMVSRIFLGFMELQKNDETKDKPFGWNGPESWASTLGILENYLDLGKPLATEVYYTNEFLTEE